MMKTTIEIDSEGNLSIETFDRGTSAERWLGLIQGKKSLSLAGSNVLAPEPPPVAG
jgi:hypothetical protein